jgi:hypothetical protein
MLLNGLLKSSLMLVEGPVNKWRARYVPWILVIEMPYNK